LGTGAGWSLTLFNQSLRTVWVTLTPIDGSVPAAPSGFYSQNVELYSWCFDASGTRVSYLSIPAGTSNNQCIFSFDFASGRTKYKLAMGQFPSPASGSVSVACLSAGSNGQCNRWTLTPNSIAPNANIANLYKFANNGSLVYVGQYFNTFRIDISIP
jgi:hypothetical protein